MTRITSWGPELDGTTLHSHCRGGSSILLGSTMVADISSAYAPYVKLVVYVPSSHAEVVRQTLGNAGAGIIGNYDHCSYTSIGVGRFRGNEHSNPAIGTKHEYESVDEERIEVNVDHIILKEVIKKLRAVHPYEEPAIDIYPLLQIP